MPKFPFIKKFQRFPEKKYQNLLNQINLFEDKLKLLTDNELRERSLKLKKHYSVNKILNPFVAEAFALTREASVRTLGLRHFDVQLMGGLVLNNQKISEMRTGEGKTLVATLPAFLNSLTNKGVHIVTVNEYLANRDQVSMGQIYRFLGLNTGLIQSDMLPPERRENYFADITYTTNYEVAFDYLRDHKAETLDDIVLRPFHYCIVDEVDSILIDEAQVPLVLANPIPTAIEKYVGAAEIVEYLKLNKHYKIDEKNKNIILTSDGSKQIETILGIQDLYNPNNPWIPNIINAIKANALYFKNVDYIIQNEKIIIVDEFTGRIMPDRRWGDGLHQAIEAKEKLQIRQKSETVASITYQNFFSLYPKLSGMTGTGKTAEFEFKKIYKLPVEEIPTSRVVQRKDSSDLLYKDQFSKWNAVSQACKKISFDGQPILVGTTTIEKSEMLGQLLKEYNLRYQILNAKPENLRKESEIISQAGKKGSITIATNMAGRGTDIILGGNIDFKIQKQLYEILTFGKRTQIFQTWILSKLQGSSHKFFSVFLSLMKNKKFLKLSDLDILRVLRQNDRIFIPKKDYQCSIKFLTSEFISYNKKLQTQENKIVKNLGGLYVIGTERNDSRRIDNQLRGRCGRQGDPGTSRFFVSLEDNLLRLFGGQRIQNFMQNQILDDSPLESKFLTKSLDRAQQRVEERAYEQRKNLFDYDDILNKQRNIFYEERKHILGLDGIGLEDAIFSCGEQFITDIVLDGMTNSIHFSQLITFLENILNTQLKLKKIQLSTLNKLEIDELKGYLFHEFWLSYQCKTKALRVHHYRSLEPLQKNILLGNTDKIWREYLQRMGLVKEAVVWRGYGQQNPLDEYKKEAFSIFVAREKLLRQLVIYDFLRLSVF